MSLDFFDIQKCIHCGLCLHSCPTFVETGEEAHSPRGRIYSMRAVAEGRMTWEDIQPQIDSCLGCLACETACPSPVPYERMLESSRQEIESRRSAGQRFLRNKLLAIATDAGTSRRAARAGRLLPFAPALFGKWLGGAPLPILPVSTKAVPEYVPAEGKRRGLVTLLAGCAQRVALPEINIAAAKALAACGYDVSIPPEPTCCGALHRHNGYPEEGLRLARIAASRWSEVEALVIASAGCGSFVKQYPRLIEGFRAPVYDFAEFMLRIGWEPGGGGAPMRLALHDACHLQHGQGVYDEPRRALAKLPNVKTVELSESYCCGSAGVYSVFQPHMAKRLLARKLEAILATGADAVLSSNPGCTLWLRQGLAARGVGVRVMHLAEVLAERMG